MSDDQLDEISIRAAEATGAVSDTPRTDACPHCGDKYDSEKFFRYECGTLQQFPSGTIRTELCHQTEVSNIWQKRAKKAEAEVERLRELLNRSIEIQEEMCTGCRCWHCDDLRMELESIRMTNNSTNTRTTTRR